MKTVHLDTILATNKQELLSLVPKPSRPYAPLTNADYNKTDIFFKNYSWYCVVIGLSGKLGDSKKRAAKMNFDFNLDLTYLVELWLGQKGRCNLTGAVMEFTPGNLKDKNPKSVSVDRIDNEKGYIKGNVRLLTHWANNSKSTWDHEVFETMVKSAATHLLNEGA
jgi:hypothetical protein